MTTRPWTPVACMSCAKVARVCCSAGRTVNARTMEYRHDAPRCADCCQSRRCKARAAYMARVAS